MRLFSATGLLLVLGLMFITHNFTYINSDITDIHALDSELGVKTADQDVNINDEFNKELSNPIARLNNLIVPEDESELLQAKAQELNPFYSIQIGAFKNKTNARNIYLKLQKNGYQVYLINTPGPKGRLFHVRVGIFQSKTKATQKATNLSNKEKLDTYIVKVDNIPESDVMMADFAN